MTVFPAVGDGAMEAEMKAMTQEGEGRGSGMKNHRIVVSRHGGPEVLQRIEEDLAGDGLSRRGSAPVLSPVPCQPGRGRGEAAA